MAYIYCINPVTCGPQSAATARCFINCIISPSSFPSLQHSSFSHNHTLATTNFMPVLYSLWVSSNNSSNASGRTNRHSLTTGKSHPAPRLYSSTQASTYIHSHSVHVETQVHSRRFSGEALLSRTLQSNGREDAHAANILVLTHGHLFAVYWCVDSVFDMLMLGLMGRAIQATYGNKYIYWLYGLGAVFGGLTTSVFQRPSPYIQPQVGAESVVAAYLTFLGMLNPHQTFMLFFFPVRAWVLLAVMGTYSLMFDPQKKIFAGMTAGLTVYQMMRVGFLWWSQ